MYQWVSVPAGYIRLHNTPKLPIVEGQSRELKFVSFGAVVVAVDPEAKLPNGQQVTRQHLMAWIKEAARQIDDHLYQRNQQAEVAKRAASRREYDERIARDRAAQAEVAV